MAICNANCIIIFIKNVLCIVVIAVCTSMIVNQLKIQTKQMKTETNAEDGINNVAYAILTIGVVIVFSSLIGCCGAIQNRKFLMIAYFICSFMLLWAEISLTIVTMVHREKIFSELKMSLMMQKLHAKDATLSNPLDYPHDWNKLHVCLQAWLQRDTSIITGFGIGMAILQVVGMVISACIFCTN